MFGDTIKSTQRGGSCGVNPASATNSAGFTLIEAVIALIVIMVGVLGVFSVFTYAVMYNAGNKARADALTVLQQEVERYRAAKFNAISPPDNFTPVDSNDPRRDITGGRKATRTVTTSDGLVFNVSVSVDNDPNTPNVPDPPNLDVPQNESFVCQTPQGAATPCTLKEITIEVRLAAPSPGWQTAVPVRAVLRRTRGN
jgi:type II secretory pathway pseudopilin PulG